MKDRKGNDVKVGDRVSVEADGVVLEHDSIGRVHKLKDVRALVIAADATTIDEAEWMGWCYSDEFELAALVSEKEGQERTQ
jgi:hypothetical protein